VAVLLAVVGAMTGAARGGGFPGCGSPPHILVAKAKAGEQPLVVQGQVVRADGKTPAAGVVVYVYQTDTTGRYNEKPGAPPRLRGWMQTDVHGNYEYRTIRPAPYPGGRVPAHVHTQLWGPGVPEQWGTELLFADDPALPAAERERSQALGRFAYVCSPRRDDHGWLHCRHDLRLKTTGDRIEANSRHGLLATERSR
jgi:protocatechuate 3,4-dioxygenase beta subunit